MKKFLTVLIIIIFAIAAVLAAATFVYTRSADYQDDSFPENTTINGVDCSELSYKTAASRLTDTWNTRTIVISGVLNEELASFSNYRCSYSLSAPLAEVKKQNLLLAAANHYFHTPINASIPMLISDYSESFKKNVLNSDFLNNPNATETTAAYVDLTDPDFSIVPEVYGTKPDKEKFFNDLLHSIELGDLTFQYDEKNYYTMPEVKADNEELLNYQSYCRKYLKQKITYELGDSTFTIEPAQLSTLFQDDLSGKPDKDAVKNYVALMAAKYDNVGIERNFKSLTGKQVHVTGGTYGWEIAQEKETEHLIKDLNSHEDVSREPEWYISGWGEYSNGIGDTYIDVDITKQKVCAFKNGKLVFSESCVTGCKATGHMTSTGTFYVLNKLRNVVLRGDNGDGTEYESPVQYWMGVTWDGQGFHDADWRNKFGGKIWVSNGSHGCINMPPKRMPALYNQIETSTPVVMHY